MMKIYRSLDEIPADFGPSSVTIGKFDGLHLGHQRMIEFVREEAARRSLAATALTFDRHPYTVIRPEACPLPLVGNAQKLELLASTGLDAAVMLEFTKEFSRLSPEEFVEGILVTGLRARLVVVGKDYRFGAGGAGTVGTLADLAALHGFDLVAIDEVLADAGAHAPPRRVSSTWVRELLTEGRVREASRLLGRPPAVRGVVVRGAQRGRELGFPTANLSPDLEGFIPDDGVYAGWLVVGEDRLPAAISVGDNPTFQDVPKKQVEAHVLDRELDLYGAIVEVEFVERIRGMERFDSVDELIEEIAADVRIVRSLVNDDTADG